MSDKVVIMESTDSNISGTFALAADNQVLPAPGFGKRWVITSFVIQNESQSATTMILHNGAPVNGWRCYAANQGDGLSKDFSDAHPWKLAYNTPLYLYLSGANSCGYSIQYHSE